MYHIIIIQEPLNVDYPNGEKIEFSNLARILSEEGAFGVNGGCRVKEGVVIKRKIHFLMENEPNTGSKQIFETFGEVEYIKLN